MASTLPPAPAGQPVLVRIQALDIRRQVTPRWQRLLPAWILSGIVHVGLLLTFLLINGPGTAESVGKEQTVVLDTKVDESKPPPDLEQVDIGSNPDLSSQLNVPRIESVTIPGEVRPEASVGMENAPSVPPLNVPPPAGLGSTGQGGALDAPLAGKGNAIGSPGGYGTKTLLPGGFDGRGSAATREQLWREGGGNEESEAAVARGLKWLANHQGPDGRWSLDAFNRTAHCNCTGTGQNYDIAATAFGLLPLLGAGQTHRPNTQKENTYSKNVERGLKYLLSKQTGSGDFGGGMYSHGLATITVCEAFGLTSDPFLRDRAQKAVNFIVAAQSDNGGWRYVPRGGGDTSVVGWEVMALQSARMAGLEVPQRSLDGATKWLNSVASPDGGGYGYTSPASGASAMTAAGLLCREYLGWGPRNPGLTAGVTKLMTRPPKAANSIYYTYYATQVMHHFGGEPWNFWNPRMRDYLIATQDKGTTRQHPHQLGSWDPKPDPHGGAGGRIMTTSLSLLSLEVYYRYLPLYRRGQLGGNK
jgi:hypothetical protein